MTRSRIALGLALAVTGARPALGAAAVLEVPTTCADAALEPGAGRDVPIELAGGGQLIGALGFTLRFDPGLLLIRPEDFAVGEAGQCAGTDVMARAGRTAGTMLVQVVPTVRARVAPIPDGEVVRVRVRVPDDVAANCTALTLEAVTFHDTVAGFRLAGTVTGGALATVSCTARTGLPGVRCRIAVVLDLIRQASSDAIARRTRKKLAKLASRILARVDAFQTGPPKRARRLLRVLGKRTKALVRKIDRADRKHKIDPELAGRLRTQTTGAGTLLADVLAASS